MFKFQRGFVYYSIDDIPLWPVLPDETELFIVDANEQIGVKEGWSKRTWCGDEVTSLSVEEYRKEVDPEDPHEYFRFRTPIDAFRKFTLRMLDSLKN